MNLKSIGFILISLAIMSFKPSQKDNIVIIGDSNGASPIGWVVKLDSMLDGQAILNYSVAGNTIGFDNLGRESLNALKNINRNLSNADSTLEQIDMVIVALGTNDCKVVFDSLLTIVPDNMRKLIAIIKNYPYKNHKIPKILIVSPPEVGPDSTLLPKYFGIGKRLDYLLVQFEKLAEETNCEYLDIRITTSPEFENLTADGIHFNDKGYLLIAKEIFTKLQ